MTYFTTMVYFLWVNKPRIKLKWAAGLKRKSADCYSPGITSLKVLEINFYVKGMSQILPFWNRAIWFCIILRQLYVTGNSLINKFCWSECLAFSKRCIFKHWKFKDFWAAHVQIKKQNETKTKKTKHKPPKQHQNWKTTQAWNLPNQRILLFLS